MGWADRKGESIAVHTQGGGRITWQAVVRVVLCVSLLAAFAGFAAAALCLQPHQQGPASASHSRSILMGPGRDGASDLVVTASAVQAPPVACCYQENSPPAVTAFGRSLTPPEALALAAGMETFRGAAVPRPVDFLGPPPEKGDQFRPSLTALSVSLT